MTEPPRTPPKPTAAALAEQQARIAALRAVFAERRAQERSAELPQDVRDMMKTKGMM